jgi:type I restriction enzyme S subunit
VKTYPAHWGVVRLGEVVDILDARRVPVNAKEREKRFGSVPYYGATGQVGWIDAALFDEELVLLGEDGAPVLDANKPKAYIIRGRAWVNNHAHVLRATEATSNKFLVHTLNAMDYGPFVNGTTRLKLTQAAMKEMPLPLPPLAEQDRIVGAIEEQFSRLDAGQRSLSDVTRKLVAFRRAVLAAAVPRDGEWVLTSDVAEVRGGIQKQPKRRPIKNRFPFLRVANVGRNRLDLSDVHEVELFDGELERFRLERGDLLVVEGNGSPEQIGRSAMWRDEIADCVHQNHLIRVRPQSAIDPEYLALYWNTPQTAERLRAVASSTSGLYTLSTAKVKLIPVPVVELTEQRRIVENVQQRLSLLDAITVGIGQAVARSAQLRRSILERAYSGQLVPKDWSDEPASDLLAGIAAKATMSTSRRRQRA